MGTERELSPLHKAKIRDGLLIVGPVACKLDEDVEYITEQSGFVGSHSFGGFFDYAFALYRGKKSGDLFVRVESRAREIKVIDSVKEKVEGSAK